MELNKIYENFVFENEYEEDEDDLDQWTHGKCIPFAVALCDVFPEYKIAVINDLYETDDEEVEYNINFVHAFCYHPIDHTTIVDGFGIRNLNTLYDDYYDVNIDIDWEIPNAKYLIDYYAGKEFYSEESFEYDENEFKEAKEYILNHLEKYKI